MIFIVSRCYKNHDYIYDYVHIKGTKLSFEISHTQGIHSESKTYLYKMNDRLHQWQAL